MNMPFTLLPFSEKEIMMNRHSFGDVLCRRTKADFDIQHRSIQSDPGVHFDLKRQSNHFLMQHFKNLELDCKGRLKKSRKRLQPQNFARNTNQTFGQIRQFLPMYGCFSTGQYLSDAPSFPYSLELTKDNFDTLNLQNRKSHLQVRVISTSLSSSATSVYSEEDSLRFRGSPVPSCASDCPSVISTSARNSLYFIEEEQKLENSDEFIADRDLKSVQNDDSGQIKKSELKNSILKNNKKENISKSNQSMSQIIISLQETCLQSPLIEETLPETCLQSTIVEENLQENCSNEVGSKKREHLLGVF